MTLYTRTGDDGATRLLGGQRVPKSHPRVESYGAVDEVNAVLGWAGAAIDAPELIKRIRIIQGDLFTVGAQLATAEEGRKEHIPDLEAGSVARLESWIDEACKDVSELTHFVLPGGSESAARMHLARTACRRAERLAVSLAEREKISTLVVPYLNRLGDLLFAWARWLNDRAAVEELLWP